MVVAVALRGYGPVTVAAARTALGATALLALALALGRPRPRRDPMLAGFVGVLGVLTAAAPFLLLAWGQQHVPSAFAGLSMAVLPLFLLPLAHFFVPGERLTRRRATGFGLGLLGAAILLGPDVSRAGDGDFAALGRLACLAATLCYAVGSVTTRRCPEIDPIWLSALSLGVGGVLLIPAMLLVEGVPDLARSVETAAIVLLGLVPTGLAALLRVQVIRSAGPSFLTLVNYQVPVWAMLFGVVVLDEALPGRFFLALALIAIGLLVSQWRRGGR
jgi:drug/metabolite transporter (DMT)-like permease